ncbi:MAG: glycerophosphodiester phosphodiesterase [Paludibacterium sp.]|uniref:glycerophosphodiester phosphodiesterase n=1 Tax=Paludibacterium sp. TaxID=1917523 RepID=UPI0025D5D504|nr:glycerophosphodiester phosphodiesterase [Paludibacterium sp.]MBV8047807.1 glycerophosphodiester phosphodiesterase [Paludibacterium sp.]MBV8646665.1 glycerophosphodiester phosphodiesterase [Paludibacterium sp.]
MQPWPYPRIFAHRLGGSLAPENTLTGLRRGYKIGVRAVECDVKLSADGVLFLLHDDTLERTTTGAGPAGALTMAQLRELDCGVKHHRAYRGEVLPTLEELAAFCIPNGVAVNLEIKPNPGQDEETGRKVALAAKELWRGAAVQPLLSSFSPSALRAARQAVPELPRACLVEDIPLDYLTELNQCAAAALHADHRALTQDAVQKLHSQGYRIMAYTVNDPLRARKLLSWGVDMLCSDRPDLMLTR